MRDYKLYYEMMGKNLLEKIDFIVEELQTDLYTQVIDFGCADGQVTRALAELFPCIQFLGIDCDEAVIRANSKNNQHTNLHFICADMIPEDLKDNKYTLIIFSSVFHEIFSFKTENEIRDLIYNNTFAKAVAIRDMIFIENKGALRHDVNYMLTTFDKKMFREYATIKEPSITDKTSDEDIKEYFLSYKDMLAEFLLKSQYKRNWKDELKENYYSTNWGLIEFDMIKRGFYISYCNIYMNTYLREKLHIDLFTLATHKKIIFKDGRY